MIKYNSKNFQLDIESSNGCTSLTQMVSNSLVHTSKLPQTLTILESKIPSIFLNKCFNSCNRSFKKEVVCTEAGHLFEHLIIEHLKMEAESRGLEANYNGVTEWNWNKEQYGKFNILIKYGLDSTNFVESSIEKAIIVMEEIFNSEGGLETRP